jgi:hypothetical protein
MVTFKSSDADEARQATSDLLAICQVMHAMSATENIHGSLLKWLAGQVCEGAATISLALQSGCEGRRDLRP